METDRATKLDISPKILSRQNRTRQRILRESANLFVRSGFENVSVEDIIEAAEIARSSFYRFFSNREQVLANIIRPVFEQGIEDLKSISTDDPRELAEGIFQTYFNLWKSGVDELRVSTHVGGVYFYLFQDSHNEFRETLSRLFEAIEPSGILLNDNAEYSLRIMTRSVVPVMEVYSKEQDFEELFRKTMRGMLLKCDT